MIQKCYCNLSPLFYWVFEKYNKSNVKTLKCIYIYSGSWLQEVIGVNFSLMVSTDPAKKLKQVLCQVSQQC